jgi:phenylacetate-CoA ligase
MGAVPRDNIGREDLERFQGERLAELFRKVLPHNPFYARKLSDTGIDPLTFVRQRDWLRVPFTTKAEFLDDQERHPPYGSFHSLPRAQYCRLHQTSGTATGKPLRWLDTTQTWSAMLDSWVALFRIAGIRPDDRLFFPFSFGPFLGFWTAFDSAWRQGCFCLSGGGMSSSARLRFLMDNAVTVVLCTPTYALRLVEVAREEKIDLPSSPVRALIVAGEPGGSVPGTRQRIEAGWGARVFDHTGMTECGPIGIECNEAPGGLHLLETECVAEVIDERGKVADDGTLGELVLTTLARPGSPLVRYRTGDLVRFDPRPCPCGRALRRLEGGIRGRADDMIVVRGNNFHPGALQSLLHQFPEVSEYRLEVDETSVLPVLRVDIEPHPNADPGLIARVDQAIRNTLLFRAEVRTVPPGSLPRFEMKARRLVRKSKMDP